MRTPLPTTANSIRIQEKDTKTSPGFYNCKMANRHLPPIMWKSAGVILAAGEPDSSQSALWLPIKIDLCFTGLFQTMSSNLASASGVAGVKACALALS